LLPQAESLIGRINCQVVNLILKGKKKIMVRQHTALVRFALALWAICLLALAPSAQAAPAPAFPAAAPQAAGDGFWDDRFGLPGAASTVYDIAVAADGSAYATVDEREVVQWNGRAWRSLGESSSGFVYAIATIGSTPYVAGSFTNIGAAPVKYLAKWNGSAWVQVGSGVGPETDSSDAHDGVFTALAAVGGTLYAGGHFSRVDGVAARSIAAWNGSAWSALGAGVSTDDFGTTVPGDVAAIVPAGGKLYVGGTFEMAGGQAAGSIAAWDGANWSALGGAFLQDDGFGGFDLGNVAAIAVSGGTVYAGGQFTRVGGTSANNVAAWNGASWSALGSGITGDSGYTMGVRALLADGSSLLVGGEFSAAGGQAIGGFARWNGSGWSAAATLSSYETVNALARVPGGSYYVGGDFDQIDGVLAGRIALRAGQGWQALGQGLTSGDNNCCAGKVYAVADDGAGHVYVGGRFATAGGVAANNIAMWDGTRWQALGAGVADGDVRALLLRGADLYVGGTFKSAGGASIQYLAKWNTTTRRWSGMGSGVNGDVYTLEEANGVIYAGGDMSAAGGVKVSNIAAWNGSSWSALSSKLLIREIFDNCSEAGTQVYSIKASGRYLVIGGHFRLVQIGFAQPCAKESYFPANNILIWDRVADEWFFMGKDGTYGVAGGDSLFPSVNALEVVGGPLDAGGALYVGGEFGQAGLVPAAGLAKFQLQGGWQAVGGVSGGTGAALSGPGVFALKASGSDLYVGGNFTTAGSGAAGYVARYSTASGAWSPLGSGADRTVLAMDIAPDGLYVGGEFSTAAGRPSAGVGRWGAPIITGNVAAAGGTVEGDGVSISFPAGAVSGSTTVILTPLSAPFHAAPSGRAAVRAFRFEARGANGQPIAQFAQPYTLRVSYTDQMLAAAGVQDPASLTLAYWNGSAWAPMLPCQGCSVDTAKKVITVVSNHFTEFALIGKATRRDVFVPLARR
jgi:hypothetical protein